MIVIRNVKEDDVERLLDFVKVCKPLTKHTLYTYWVLTRYFSNLCFLCETKTEEIVGLITGIISSSLKDTAFIWQIGVRQDYRRQGIAMNLIDRFIYECMNMNIKKVEFTIEKHNIPSIKLFKKYADINGIYMKEIKTVKTNYWEEVIYQYELK